MWFDLLAKITGYAVLCGGGLFLVLRMGEVLLNYVIKWFHLTDVLIDFAITRARQKRQ